LQNKIVDRSIAYKIFIRGKSGQHRASYFLAEDVREGVVMQQKITAKIFFW